MIFVTGDTHGYHSRIEQIIGDAMPEEGDTMIISGDFGMLFWNTLAERNYLDFLEKLPFDICFVDGNHENFRIINQYPIEVWNGGKIHRIRKNIIHLIRGQIYEIEGVTIFTFGGAYSMDRWRRERNYTYWDEELPNNEEYHEAAQNMESHNMKVDYILTHTAPTSMIHRMGKTPDQHDIELTGFFDWLLREVEFKHWYCGHWHMDKTLTENFTVLLNEVVELGKGVKNDDD